MDDQFTLDTPASAAPSAEIKLAGKSADGSRLLLHDENGNRFELPIDERLMSMVAREQKAAAAKAVPVRQAPPPREIQERVRHGESVTQVAAASGVQPALIERFARTVLIERGHVADQASKCLVRMGNDHQPLAEVICEQVSLPAASIQWDSWRCEDGSWTVQATFAGPNGTRSAQFSYNAAEKSVRPADDRARMLLVQGVPNQPADEAPEPAHEPVRSASARSNSTQSAAKPAATRPAESVSKPAAPAPAASAAPKSDESSSPRTWDRAHPAARAHERRTAENERRTAESARAAESAHPATNSSQPKPASNGSAPAAAQAPKPEPRPEALHGVEELTIDIRIPKDPAPEPPKQPERPQWEELLFGTPTE